MTTTEQQLQELEAKKAEIAKLEEKLRLEQEYAKRLIERDEAMNGELVRMKTNNEKVANLYKALVTNKTLKSILTLKSSPNEITTPRYLRDRLKPEDIIIKQTTISTIECESLDFTIRHYDIERGKVQLPGKISSRYQYYKVESAIKKIIEYKEKLEREKQEKIKLEEVADSLIDQFKSQYPDATFKSDQVWIPGYGRNTRGYYVDALTITFPNTSWVSIKYYANGSWSIHEKYKANVKPLTKEEIIADLAR